VWREEGDDRVLEELKQVEIGLQMGRGRKRGKKVSLAAQEKKREKV